MADAIRRLFDGRGIKTKDVAASLSGNAVIVKKISLPIMSDGELAESIYWEAEQYIPFDIQDVNLDYQILDRGDAASGKGTMDVLLVAAKKEKIADYTGVIAQAGRAAVVVDVDAFALQNAYEVNYGIDPNAVVVLLNAGASATNINILQGDQSVFTRDISIGGNAYTEALQRELNLPFEIADALKRGLPADGVTYDDARPVLRAVTENVMLEIQKTFDFFKATAASDKIDRIMLERRRVARRGVHRDAGGSLRGAGRAVRSVQEGRVRREEVQDRRRRRHRADRGRRGRPGPPPGGRPMIRINLLAVERGAAQEDARRRARRHRGAARHHRRGADPPLDRRRHRVVVLVAAHAVEVRLDEDIARAEIRGAAAALGAGPGAEVRDPQGACCSSASRSIEQLRRGQSAPVHILDEISKALPDRLWLVSLGAARQGLHDRRPDDVADRRSRTSSRTSRPAAGSRSRSRSSTARSIRRRRGDLVRFTIRATTENPEAPPPPAPAGRGAPPAR